MNKEGNVRNVNLAELNYEKTPITITELVSLQLCTSTAKFVLENKSLGILTKTKKLPAFNFVIPYYIFPSLVSGTRESK